MSKVEMLMRSLSIKEQRIHETMQKLDAAGKTWQPVDAELVLLGNGTEAA